MAKVLVPLAKGFEDLEFVTIVDVLRRGGVDVATASLGDDLAVPGAHGVLMRADARLADVEGEAFDAIVLPGGGEGTANLAHSAALQALLQKQNAEGRWLCAICAAPTVLVQAGVVAEGLHVTCYPTMQMELDRPWSPAAVVVDGNVITGQAPGSALLFALVVLQHLTDAATAHRVARGMVTDVLD